MNPETLIGEPVGAPESPALSMESGAPMPMPMPAFGEVDLEVAKAVASAETGKAKVVAKGIYLEFVRTTGAGYDETTQHLIIPTGTTPQGNEVGSLTISRSVNKWSPRAQWRFNFADRHSTATYTNQERVTNSVTSVTNNLKRMVYYSNNELSLRGGKPIAFEITDVDYTDIEKWATPSALMRRIQKTRIALGFPEKLV